MNIGNIINSKGLVIGMTRLKKPWYAPDFLIKSKMKDSISEYSNINGLKNKMYSMELDTGLFGGVYLWENERVAKEWWNESFFERVNKKYGGNNKIPLKQALFIHSIEKREKAVVADRWIFIKRYTIPSDSISNIQKHFEDMIPNFQKSKGYISLWVAGCENSQIEIISLWSDSYSMKEANFNECTLPNWKEEDKIVIRSPIQINHY
jgi:heme-degrading monooxygenase HmoA